MPGPDELRDMQDEYAREIFKDLAPHHAKTIAEKLNEPLPGFDHEKEVSNG
jgi:hypothetical protein